MKRSVDVVFGRLMRGVVEGAWRAVGGEGQKVFVAALTHGSQQVNAMGVWS